jgi:hypothetical protein
MNVLPLPTQVQGVLNSAKALDSHHTVQADEPPDKVKQNRKAVESVRLADDEFKKRARPFCRVGNAGFRRGCSHDTSAMSRVLSIPELSSPNF